jgi:DNA polymerase
MMKTLSIDIETYSDEDLSAVGVYKYAASPSFRVLLFGYSIDGRPVEVVDLANGEGLPTELLVALDSQYVTKQAFNASFERVCLTWHLIRNGCPSRIGYLDPAQWCCTMVQAACWGVFGSLKQVGAYLKVDTQKDAAGTRLINKYSKPQDKPVPYEGEDWERFKAYCKRDVESELAIASALPGAIPDREQELYVLDQRINDVGIKVDTQLAENAVQMAEANNQQIQARLKDITRLANPNSIAQLKMWLYHQGVDMPELGREKVEAALAGNLLPRAAREVLKLRLAGAKSTNKKYIVAAAAADTNDSRLRGSFRFYGASTGRWSGRLMQLQNLARGDLHGRDQDIARELVRAGDREGLELLYGDVADTLKSLIRTSLIPADGHTFCVADFSSIEARVLAWLAGEEWALEVFRGDGKVYEATAARMTGVPVSKVTGDLRQRGKVATLALGYQGGPGALERMGAVKMGVPKRELPKLVRMWRNVNPCIVALWRDVEAVVRAVAIGGLFSAPVARGFVTVERKRDAVLIHLPAGRALVYRGMRVDPYSDRLSYDATGARAASERTETYGGRLVENITQAVARDLLADAMFRMDEAGLRIVAHVHDEVIVETLTEDAEDNLDGMIYAMSEAPEWAPGLPLSAEGYTCTYYHKE